MPTTATLKLNFFVVPIADEHLPLFTRPVVGDEKLRLGEQRWRRNARELGTGEVLAVLTTQKSDLTEYELADVATDLIPPGIMKGLLRSGLQDFFQSSQYVVESSHLGFSCFRLAELVRENIPSFVTIRRGLEFQADHFSIDRQRVFGFFISTKVRVQFRESLAIDDRLARAALEQRVAFHSNLQTRSGILKRVDLFNRAAEILDEQGQTHVVPVADVDVPASPATLNHYCHLLGQPGLATQVRRAALMASYRLGRNGQRNRRWLAEQMAQVRSWLIAASQYDRLSFNWPNSTRRIFLHTKPLEIVEGEIV